MKRTGFVVVVLVGVISSGAMAGDPYIVAWSSQIGTSVTDYARSVAVDASGMLYVSGNTWGNIGSPPAGLIDAVLVKFDPNGGVMWSRQLGTTKSDDALGVAADAWGNAYIAGATGSSLIETCAGSFDAFLVKYDPNGNILWSRQIGTTEYDEARSVAVDGAGNAYIAGFTSGALGGPRFPVGDDAFLAKYDPNGDILWSRQLGTPAMDRGYSIAVDASGNAYIGGMTKGNLAGINAGGNDAFLAKYDPNGDILWSRQFGTTERDDATSVAVDAWGNAYVSGFTAGSFSGQNAGEFDVFLAKYDPNGDALWSRQMGTAEYEHVSSMAVDGAGNAFITGHTSGDLGEVNAGSYDAFLMKYDPAGDLLWSALVGTSAGDMGMGVATDSVGNVYIAGVTGGDLGGPNAGESDIFLTKCEVPEPASMSLLRLGGLALLRRRQSGDGASGKGTNA